MSTAALSTSLADVANPSRRFDRQLWLMLAIAALILFPRSLMITKSQSERVDDEYHIQRGVAFLNRQLTKTDKLPLNDPPTGEGLTVLPLWLMHVWRTKLPLETAIWNQRWKPDTILNAIGAWKTFLFLPMLGVVFVWIRSVYGLKSAWLTTALLLIEPTITAHTPLPTLDVLGAEGIVIGCFFSWRYFEKPTWGRLSAAAISIGTAMVLKHTAFILPGVAMIFAVMWWIVRPWREGRLRESWRGKFRPRMIAIMSGAGIMLLTIWALCLFDISKPNFPMMPPNEPGWPAKWEQKHPLAANILDRKLPAGLYISSILEAQQHSQLGHQAFLLGERRKNGWWYYFPVVATYKVPIGIGLVLVMGIISLAWIAPIWQEWGLLIPMLAWSAFMMNSKIDIGFRHFLPAYIFMIFLASRIIVSGSIGWLIAAWISVGIACAHTLTYHPDYLCYINYPREAWLDISDSNIDWGQGLKYVRHWIDKHPNRQVAVRDFGWGDARLFNVRERLGPKVTLIDRMADLPTQGILIISPVALVGAYEPHDRYKVLRGDKPIEILGNAMRVYDLDRLRKRDQPFQWKTKSQLKHTTSPTTEPADETKELPS
jgi:hypothetical protein